MKSPILSILAFCSINAFAETDLNRVYVITARRCLNGTVNPDSSPIKEGVAVTRDFFFSDSKEINHKLDAAKWENVEIEYNVSGSPDTICANHDDPTKYLLTLRRVR